VKVKTEAKGIEARIWSARRRSIPAVIGFPFSRSSAMYSLVSRGRGWSSLHLPSRARRG
jgi:hypothetical protein